MPIPWSSTSMVAVVGEAVTRIWIGFPAPYLMALERKLVITSSSRSRSQRPGMGLLVPWGPVTTTESEHPAELQLPGRRSAHVQERVDQLGEASELLVDPLHARGELGEIHGPLVGLGGDAQDAVDLEPQAGERRLQLVAGDGEELVAQLHGGARLVVEPRVLHCQSGAPPELAHHLQILGAVAAFR